MGPADDDGERAAVQDSAAQTDGNDRMQSTVGATTPAVVYICEPLVPTTYAKSGTETVAASAATTSTTTTTTGWRRQPVSTSVAKTEDERNQQPGASRPSRIQRYTGRAMRVAPSPEATKPDLDANSRETPSPEAVDSVPDNSRRLATVAVPVAATSTSSSRTTVEDLASMLPDLPEGEAASNAKPA